MTTFLLVTSHLIAAAAGAYGWYRFGTKLQMDANLIRETRRKL